MSDLEIDGVPINKMRVVELKNALEERGLSKSGRKDELVARLTSYIEEEGSEADKEPSKESDEDPENILGDKGKVYVVGKSDQDIQQQEIEKEKEADKILAEEIAAKQRLEEEEKQKAALQLKRKLEEDSRKADQLRKEEEEEERIDIQQQEIEKEKEADRKLAEEIVAKQRLEEEEKQKAALQLKRKLEEDSRKADQERKEEEERIEAEKKKEEEERVRIRKDKEEELKRKEEEENRFKAEKKIKEEAELKRKEDERLELKLKEENELKRKEEERLKAEQRKKEEERVRVEQEKARAKEKEREEQQLKEQQNIAAEKDRKEAEKQRFLEKEEEMKKEEKRRLKAQEKDEKRQKEKALQEKERIEEEERKKCKESIVKEEQLKIEQEKLQQEKRKLEEEEELIKLEKEKLEKERKVMDGKKESEASAENNNGSVLGENTTDDTLVMEVDQHDLVAEDAEDKIISAEPGEVTSFRKLGGSKTSSESERGKRGWGASRSNKNHSSGSVEISSDSLKDLVPDMKPLMSVEAKLDEEEEDVQTIDSDADVAGPKIPEKVKNESGEPVKKRKKIVLDNSEETNIILIINLTRPFTANQLKEMLKRTGTIEDFWIDRIKSKCCVKFSSKDQASETKMALDGVTWPQGNPKALRVSFSTEKDLDNFKEGTNEGNGRLMDIGGRNGGPREWDKVKLEQDRERPKEREVVRYKRDSREKEREEKDNRGESEEKKIATKCLEDLFKKTSAIPAIYWKSVTEEERMKKEEEKNKKAVEAKILKEMMDTKESLQRSKQLVPERRKSRSSSGSSR